MILFGYRKGGKRIAYVGFHDCNNCHNLTNFYLYETSFRPTLYFVPIAKFNVKYFMMCSICEGGIEIDKEKALAVREENIDFDDSQKYIIEALSDKQSELNRVVLNKETYSDDQAIMQVLKNTIPSSLDPETLLLILRLKLDEVVRTK